MPQYRYHLTELGREAMMRGELPIIEDVVLGAIWEKGSFLRRGMSIPEIQDKLIDDSRSLDQSAPPLSPGMARDIRYSAGKTLEASDPLRVRQTVQSLVSLGLLERIG